MFNSLKLGDNSMSQLASAQQQKQTIGLMMFVVGFLGLSFLVTSGCILYFKQMNESEEEQSSYTILRKLGFTEKDLLKGIRLKQLFNFGIPLVVGLLHSYFAVQSKFGFSSAVNCGHQCSSSCRFIRCYILSSDSYLSSITKSH